ncbi:glycosyltransferase family 4 protein [Tilletiaria anomala UBC 951]|uniref:GDP-Man:Man(3)GlcNAc(2)-PP-Dol alpha-1,2-mannosyltransferase n=1 Tax=Tilletiaria anomala (strain ATCC 24038 / CBS 436.72 / UBC 951) TaxID=1037660 RepID=A0A066WN76_TILAU|nr:glycosyltransferase family 4 protein [Tilletiaria anomala UBC 951]KDN52434.1 glycosyltransferase family 4 protein [Tilletiaria anomala UBC 951]
MALPSFNAFLASFAFFFFLLGVSLFVGFIQLVEGHTRRVVRTNRKRRRQLLARLGITESKGGEDRRLIIGFFHPYCNAGGGGERVLFEALAYHLQNDPNVICVVYTGDVGPLPDVKQVHAPADEAAFDAAYKSLRSETQETRDSPKTIKQNAEAREVGREKKVTKEDIISKVKSRFAIELDSERLLFLPLDARKFVDDSYWKHFTLLGQSLGSVLLAFEAMSELIPDVFIDTMGYAFTYPAVRLFSKKLPIGTYTHYPTISTDMLRRIENREASHTNNTTTASSAWRSALKLRYYRTFAWIYSWALRRASRVVANGTWTRNHLDQLMNAGLPRNSHKRRRVEVVYPPCDTEGLATFPLDNARVGFVSLAQFRPEKEHATQLRFLRALLDRHPDVVAKHGKQDLKMTMMGSCRNEGDEARIEMLKALVKRLHLEEYVEFVVNAPWSEVIQRLSTASIGISTMVDEHFGMNVVEFMAAGLITLSHASAGPLLDISVPNASGERTGYHALTPDDFADRAAEILRLREGEALSIRKRARARAQNIFGAQSFRDSWCNHLWLPLVGSLGGGSQGAQAAGLLPSEAESRKDK